MSAKHVQRVDRVVIRFAGDSGDGMQLTGDRFTAETAILGNDLSTLPNFPAEIRAPQGTLPGVSSFQLHFADHDVLTPGDAPDVLVAMNPAALRANLGDLPRGATIIANSDEFTKRNLAKVGYQTNPLEDDSLESWQVQAVPLTSITVDALAEFTELTRKDKERAELHKAAVEAQQVEDHVGRRDPLHQPLRVVRPAHVHPVLQHPEVRDAPLVEGDHLPVEEYVASAELVLRDVRPCGGHHVAVPAEHPDPVGPGVEQDPHPVPLHLVHPVLTGRDVLGRRREHRAGCWHSRSLSGRARARPAEDGTCPLTGATLDPCALSGRARCRSAW